MKKFLALLLLATLGRADVVGPMPMQLPASGGIWPISGSVTYALNNALTGVASSAIDLSGNNGVYMTLTSSASGLVSVWFSNSNVSPTTGAIPAYQIQSPGNYYVPIKARYMSLTNDTQKATTKVSAFYYAATPSITVGSITLPTPTPGIAPVSITANTKITNSGTQGFTWTQTPVAVQLSSVDGQSNTGHILRFQGMPGPCASAQFEIIASQTPTAAFNSGWGTFVSASPTGGIAYGTYSDSFYIIGKSNSSTNCNGSYVVESKQ